MKKLELMIKPGTVLEMIPIAGSHISELKKQAIALSEMLGGNVAFTQNGIRYLADKNMCIEVTTEQIFH